MSLNISKQDSNPVVDNSQMQNRNGSRNSRGKHVSIVKQNSNSPQKLDNIGYENMSELQKYKELQRRTKLLYGVNDIKRMIDKSETSQYFFRQDIKFKKLEKNSPE